MSASPPLSFLWTIAGVEIFQEEDTQASSFTWTPAGLPGMYELLLEVTDSSGLTTLARRTLEVEGVHPWPSTGRTLQNSRRAPVDARANPLTNTPLTFNDTFIESQPAVAGDGTVYLPLPWHSPATTFSPHPPSEATGPFISARTTLEVGRRF